MEEGPRAGTCSGQRAGRVSFVACSGDGAANGLYLKIEAASGLDLEMEATQTVECEERA